MRNAIVLLATVSVLAACSGMPTVSDRPSAEVRAALEGLSGDYTRNRPDDFLERLDQDEFPNRDRFEQNLRLFLLRKRQIVLDLRPDPPTTAGDRLSSGVNWNKTYVTEAGVYKMEKGHCELQFRRRASGGLALTAVQGDSPF